MHDPSYHFSDDDGGDMVFLSRSLHTSAPTLLDILVRATTDAYSIVASESQHALHRFKEYRLCDDVTSRPLVQLLEENVYNLATQLPRRMSSPGNSLFTDNDINSYLKVSVFTCFHLFV